jgi:peptidoglycan/LPS O-acetylase OafA/YrhL
VKHDNANLDALRSMAVLLVLLSHLIMSSGRLDDPLMKQWGVRELAQFGVTMFFIHTSLVLMMSLRRLQGKGTMIGRFYIRRAFRIYPLAIVTVCVALAFKIPPHFEAVYVNPTSAVIWQNLLLVQNLFHSPDIVGPMWSLPLEMEMYVVLPLLYIMAKRLHSYLGAMAMIILGFGIWWLDSHGARLLGYQALMQYSPWFFMGVAAYILFRCVNPRWPAVFYGICLLVFTAVPCVTHRIMADDYRAAWIMWGAGTAFTLVLPQFMEVESPMLKRLFRAIATYSYGIYLSHVPIMWFTFHKLSAPVPVQIVLFLILIVTVPVGLYHSLEGPMIRVGHRVSELLAEKPSPREAHALA